MIIPCNYVTFAGVEAFYFSPPCKLIVILFVYPDGARNVGRGWIFLLAFATVTKRGGELAQERAQQRVKRAFMPGDGASTQGALLPLELQLQGELEDLSML